MHQSLALLRTERTKRIPSAGAGASPEAEKVHVSGLSLFSVELNATLDDN